MGPRPRGRASGQGITLEKIRQMRNLNRVVWMKGMYLAPQHLQQTDRCSDAMLAFWMRTSPLPAWGFVELSVDQDALANGAFRISMAQGIFPDGTIFSAPDSDTLQIGRASCRERV